MPALTPLPGYTTTEGGLYLPTQLRADALSDLRHPTAWLTDAFGGSRVSSGQAVSPQSSMALAAYYACLNVIAQDCAKLPFPVLRELERGREKVRTHPLWRILQRVFNRDMTAYVGRYVMTHHAVGWGNGYGLILRDRSFTAREGTVTGIYPIHPARVRPTRDQATGDIMYDISQGARWPRDTVEVPVRVPAADMLHLKGPTGDGLVGYSIAAVAAESLGLSLAAQEYGAGFFGNSAIPSGILTHPGKFKDAKAIEDFRKAWEARRTGTAVLEEGMKFEQLTIPPEDAQFLQTRQFQLREICRWFRVSPTKIADLADAHYNNVEQLNIDHVVDTLQPWHVMWEQEVWMKLLFTEPDLYVKHDTRALLRGDSQARAEYYRALFQVGAYSPNQILELEDMDIYEGGDERFMQIQMAPVRKIVDGTARQPRPVPRPVGPSGQTAAQRNGYHHAPEEPAHARE